MSCFCRCWVNICLLREQMSAQVSHTLFTWWHAITTEYRLLQCFMLLVRTLLVSWNGSLNEPSEKKLPIAKNVSKYLEKTYGSNWILFSESWYQNFQNCLHMTAKQDVKDGALPRRFNDHPKNGRYPEIERCSRTNPLVLCSQEAAEQIKKVTNSLISKQ